MAQEYKTEKKGKIDFNAMSREDIMSSFGATVDASSQAFKGNKREPLENVVFMATRAEVNAAISQLKGTESLDLENGTGRRKAVVDTLRTFASAVRVKEYARASGGEPAVPTGNVFTGLAGLESVSAGFGRGPTRRIGFDRDSLKETLAGLPDRSAVQEAVIGFREAQGVSIHRAAGADRARREAAKSSKAPSKGAER